MLLEEEVQLAIRCAPILLFDENEPFFPVRVGVLPPKLRLDDERLGVIIECAIY
ncbi:hypothetical protein MHI37_02665 [Paenibacillus sp. FSL H8-0548]|uniref:hypothetical protein n=1 Tax=Paenibacillus sp. FSL H8-0548 TaxID=1920422 RepID=UPI0015C340D3|nr:hypothetical protein [Paenibacillus sp. FSL H8-0548]